MQMRKKLLVVAISAALMGAVSVTGYVQAAPKNENAVANSCKSNAEKKPWCESSDEEDSEAVEITDETESNDEAGTAEEEQVVEGSDEDTADNEEEEEENEVAEETGDEDEIVNEEPDDEVETETSGTAEDEVAEETGNEDEIVDEESDDEAETETPIDDVTVEEEIESPLSPEDIQALDATNLSILELDVISLLTAEHIAMMPNEAVAGLLARQIAALPAPAAAGFRPAQIPYLTLEAVAAFFGSHLDYMNPEVKKAFSPEQKAVMVTFVTFEYPETTEEADVEDALEEEVVGEATDNETLSNDTLVEENVVEETLPEEEIAAPLAELGEATATDATGAPVITEADFNGSVLDATGEAQTEVTLADDVTVAGEMTIDETDPALAEVKDETGAVKPVNLVIFAEYFPLGADENTQPIYFMMGEGGIILPWLAPEGEDTPHIADLVPYKKGLKFKPHFKMALYSGYFISPGQLKVYFGMQLANGVVLKNGESIDVTINEEAVSSDEVVVGESIDATINEEAVSSDEEVVVDEQVVVDEAALTEGEI
jgi:hypothetical protein